MGRWNFPRVFRKKLRVERVSVAKLFETKTEIFMEVLQDPNFLDHIQPDEEVISDAYGVCIKDRSTYTPWCGNIVAEAQDEENEKEHLFCTKLNCSHQTADCPAISPYRSSVLETQQKQKTKCLSMWNLLAMLKSMVNGRQHVLRECSRTFSDPFFSDESFERVKSNGTPAENDALKILDMLHTFSFASDEDEEVIRRKLHEKRSEDIEFLEAALRFLESQEECSLERINEADTMTSIRMGSVPREIIFMDRIEPQVTAQKEKKGRVCQLEVLQENVRNAEKELIENELIMHQSKMQNLQFFNLLDMWRIYEKQLKSYLRPSDSFATSYDENDSGSDLMDPLSRTKSVSFSERVKSRNLGNELEVQSFEVLDSDSESKCKVMHDGKNSEKVQTSLDERATQFSDLNSYYESLLEMDRVLFSNLICTPLGVRPYGRMSGPFFSNDECCTYAESLKASKEAEPKPRTSLISGFLSGSKLLRRTSRVKSLIPRSIKKFPTLERQSLRRNTYPAKQSSCIIPDTNNALSRSLCDVICTEELPSMNQCQDRIPERKSLVSSDQIPFNRYNGCCPECEFYELIMGDDDETSDLGYSNAYFSSVNNVESFPESRKRNNGFINSYSGGFSDSVDFRTRIYLGKRQEASNFYLYTKSKAGLRYRKLENPIMVNRVLNFRWPQMPFPTILQYAILQDDEPFFEYLLWQYPALVDLCDSNGMSAAHIIVRSENSLFLNRMLTSYPDLFLKKDFRGISALSAAILTNKSCALVIISCLNGIKRLKSSLKENLDIIIDSLISLMQPKNTILFKPEFDRLLCGLPVTSAYALFRSRFREALTLNERLDKEKEMHERLRKVSCQGRSFWGLLRKIFRIEIFCSRAPPINRIYEYLLKLLQPEDLLTTATDGTGNIFHQLVRSLALKRERYVGQIVKREVTQASYSVSAWKPFKLCDEEVNQIIDLTLLSRKQFDVVDIEGFNPIQLANHFGLYDIPTIVSFIYTDIDKHSVKNDTFLEIMLRLKDSLAPPGF